MFIYNICFLLVSVKILQTIRNSPVKIFNTNNFDAYLLALTSQTHKEKYYKGRTRVSFTLEYSILSSFFENRLQCRILTLTILHTFQEND